MIKWIILFLSLTAPLSWAAGKYETHWLYNQTTNEVIVAENSKQVRPIASITKLMTAIVALDYSQDLDKKLKISNKVHTNLPGREHTRLDVLSAMLVRSDNAAAETIAEDYPGGRLAFIQAMNAKARSMGMVYTNFVDPTGLTANTSNAEELSIMINEASKYPLIRKLSTTKELEFETATKKRVLTKKLENTNKVALFEFEDVVVSKTGLTSIAGWCVAMVVEHAGQKYIMVILGAKNKLDRLKTVEQIMYNHVINHAK
jgi:D-alanyl-D-alanine endopeptidase (penicillin-binding protein 7)